MEYLAVFSPLAAFLITGIFGRKMGDVPAHIVTCAAVILAAMASVSLFFSVGMGHDPHVLKCDDVGILGRFSCRLGLAR